MKVLIVDDDEFFRELVTTYIESHFDYEVHGAGTGKEALRVCDEVALDLILLDVQLPDIEGFEVLVKIREKYSLLELPVMMVTTLTDSRKVVKGFNLGANEFITKPIDFAVASVRMKYLLQNRREFLKFNHPAPANSFSGPSRGSALLPLLEAQIGNEGSTIFSRSLGGGHWVACAFSAQAIVEDEVFPATTYSLGPEQLIILTQGQMPSAKFYKIRLMQGYLGESELEVLELSRKKMHKGGEEVYQMVLRLVDVPVWYVDLFGRLHSVYQSQGDEGIVRLLREMADRTLSQVPGNPAIATGGADRELEQERLIHAKRYRFKSLLGKGGFASVFLVWDLVLRRWVALKVLHPNYAAIPKTRRGFVREAQIMARFHHPNIVLIYEVGELFEAEIKRYLNFPSKYLKDHPTDLIYFTMQYVEGKTLADAIKTRNHFPQAEGVEKLVQIAKALQYTHEKGVTHRDIKPHNIMINKENQIQVMDFGLARVDDSSWEVGGDQVESQACTPYYASPEQISGESLDLRSDIYSFGVVAYELLTGKRPFNGANLTLLMKQHLFDTPVAPGELVTGIHPDLEKLIACCMAKNPADRYGSMKEILDVLRRIQGLTLGISEFTLKESLTDLLDTVLKADNDSEAKRLLNKLNALITLHKYSGNTQVLNQLKVSLGQADVLISLIEKSLTRETHETLFQFLRNFESSLAVFALLHCFQQEKERWKRIFLAKLVVTSAGENVLPLVLFGLELPDEQAVCLLEGFQANDGVCTGPVLLNWAAHSGFKTQSKLLEICGDLKTEPLEVQQIYKQLSGDRGSLHKQVRMMAQRHLLRTQI